MEEPVLSCTFLKYLTAMSTTEDFDIDCAKLRIQYLEKKAMVNEELENELRDLFLKVVNDKYTLQEGKDLYRKWNEKRVANWIE